MTPEKIRVADKAALLTEVWSPRLLAELNGQHVRLAKLHGAFVWHRHADADELFLVVDGSLRIDFRDGSTELEAGEMVVVPRGVEHRPVADQLCTVLLFEPADVVNTGDADDPRRVEVVDPV